MSYDIAKHSHNFAGWCAARAAGRGLTVKPYGQGVLIEALEATKLPQLLDGPQEGWPGDASAFDTLHAEWRVSLIGYLSDRGIQATHGRAAKLIAIYIKARVVMVAPDSALAKCAHPPIDSILLGNLSKSVGQPAGERIRWSSAKWTKLSGEDYALLVKSLRRVAGDEPMWKLERYWSTKVEEE